METRSDIKDKAWRKGRQAVKALNQIQDVLENDLVYAETLNRIDHILAEFWEAD